MSTLDESLVSAAKALAVSRHPTGEGGAAAMLTASGRVLTSVFAESPNEAVGLCHETGAICEAHKRNDAIVASVCVVRENDASPFVILPPCGLCCERLAFWGGNVEVAVPAPGSLTGWQGRLLRDLLPHYWLPAWPGDA